MNLSNKNLQQLLKKDIKGTQLSIYLPTHPSSNSQSLAQDTTRLKNALKEVKSDPKYDERELGDTLKQLYELIENLEFWKHQDVGLAIFANSDGYDYYNLPYETTEVAYIKNKFVVSPLFIMHSIMTEFYVLDINLSKPRLLKSNNGTLSVVDDTSIPASFEDTSARDEYKAELQHKAAPRGSGGDNRYHGHSPSDTVDQDTSQYLRLVADAVDDFMSDQDRPLLLVGEQSRVGNLRPNLKYEHTLDQSIDGNFETYTPQTLYDATIEVMRDNEAKKRSKLIDQLLSSDPKLVVSGSEDIAEAAQAGRVESIYVPAYKRTADTVQPGVSESIILQLPDDISEFESVIRDVLSQAGSVVAVEIDAHPEVNDIKALCRF